MDNPTDISKRTPNVSHSIAHYLICIHQLMDQPGYARSIDIAKKLGRTRGTVSVVLKRMSEVGLIQYDENNFIKLTEQGHEISHRVMGSKLAVSKFLQEVLGVNQEVALMDACRIEHHLSRETIQALVDYLNLPEDKSKLQKTFSCNHVSVCPEASQCNVCDSECLLNFDVESMHSV
jgi:DtxR family transcriptional regulator, Mn-dependent transcriptional regulator